MKLPIIKTLKVKVVVLALIPIALVMAIVSVITYVAIINTGREVAERRDTELARLAASRLSENLHHYVRTLQGLSASEACRSLQPDKIETMFAASKSWLYHFDGGVFVYNREGARVWASPFAVRHHLPSFPLPDLFERIHNRLRPVFSNIFSHDAVNEEVILIGVPIIDQEGNFLGALAGFCSVRYSLLGTVYARVLEFQSGRKGYAFLVDGNGRVLYHRHTSLLGTHLEASEPVARVTRGETGATLTQRVSGERIISGFAPVPETDWGIITQEEWAVVSEPIFDYLKLFWGMVWLGGLVSAGLVFFFIRRVLRPIDTLTQGAQQVADGNFAPITVSPSGDEVEALGRQFNAMALALSTSFSNLEERLAELNRTRDALEASRQRFLLFMQHLPGRAFIQDAEGLLVFANNLHRVYAGEVSDSQQEPTVEVPGVGLYDTPTVLPEEEHLDTPAGNTYWLTYRFPFVEQDHTPYTGGIAINITDRKQAEDELALHRNQLEELVAERTRDLEAAQGELIKHEKLSVLGQLTATVSHELRNPLGVIRSSIYFLGRKQPEADSKIRQHLARIEAQVELCDTIVNDLLDYTRTRQPDPIFTQITPFLEEIVAEMDLPENVQLVRDLEEDIPIVPFDRTKLRGAVTNLVENAVAAVLAKKTAKETPSDYCPEIVLGAHASRRGVRITIRDNGVGMSAETAQMAFEPLFTTRARGVGLGLAIVRKIAEEHRGQVTLSSQPGQGTVIELEIARWGHFKRAEPGRDSAAPTQQEEGGP